MGKQLRSRIPDRLPVNSFPLEKPIANVPFRAMKRLMSVIGRFEQT